MARKRRPDNSAIPILGLGLGLGLALGLGSALRLELGLGLGLFKYDDEVEESVRETGLG